MRIAVLAATGRTGSELMHQALARGHQVRALARNPASIRATSPWLTRVAADVMRPGSLTAALTDCDAVVSGLGLVKGSPPELLAQAATILSERSDLPVAWLGAFGTGPSAEVAGPATRALLRLALGREIPEKVRADELLLAAGATVFHAGPLTDGGLSENRRTVTLSEAPRRLFPRPVSRATVAAAMLDAIEKPSGGRVLVPLA